MTRRTHTISRGGNQSSNLRDQVERIRDELNADLDSLATVASQISQLQASAAEGSIRSLLQANVRSAIDQYRQEHKFLVHSLSLK